ncbi:asparagine synthase [Sphingomonas sp. So64.6b]|uniref:asparagine synthetase B family protein n=1 Tax=Sphingomonas sp. So64.6b TaxID=2997354 RepID=UPI00160341A5|nr:asparagine synthase-related protein [Sphingomonas sp. So64.6b]QNA84447.1 asparagine synthase [Sphingomonas sp. So64.6b]
MSICGRATCSSDDPRPIDRTLAALTLGSPRLRVQTLVDGARIAGCDGASVAAAPGGRGAAFDGRIDNGEDLRRALNIGAGEARSAAQLVLAAHAAWGDALCDHVIGDYALAVWNGATRRMMLAVDPGAFRPLFYWLGAGQMLFATEQRGLWADPEVPKEVDERQMAHWLAMMPRDPDRSFFVDICNVPPGHRVVWEGGKARSERWWQPETLPILKLKTDQDYEEVLRATLDQAVRCRIGADEKIGVQLSGGLDSTAVTAMAARALDEQGRGLTAFTAAPAKPVQIETRNRFSDEWTHAAALAAMYPNIEHVRIANDEMPVLEAVEGREGGQDWPILNASNTVWVDGIDRAARDRRIDVMLIGAMGNFTISHDGMAAFGQQLRQGRLLTALETGMAMRRNGGQRWLNLLNHAAAALLPNAALRRLRSFAGKRDMGLFDYSIASRAFLNETGTEDDARAVAGNLYNLAGGDSRKLRLLALARSSHRGQQYWSSRRLYGLDVRDPTGDRRLIELALMIPDEKWMRDGVPRALLRHAMAGLVPDLILNERRRGLQGADWQLGFEEALPGLKAELGRLRHSPLAARALDLDRMEKLLEDWPGAYAASSADDANTAYLLAVSRGITAGRFIRRMEGGNQ